MADTKRIRLDEFTISSASRRWKLRGGTLWAVREHIDARDGDSIPELSSWLIKVVVPAELLLGDHDDLRFSSGPYSGDVIVSGDGFEGRGRLIGFSW